jgi:hypothetical protein
LAPADGVRVGLEAAAPDTERSSESEWVAVELVVLRVEPLVEGLGAVLVESDDELLLVLGLGLSPPARGELWANAPVAAPAARAAAAQSVVIVRICDSSFAPQPLNN